MNFNLLGLISALLLASTHGSPCDTIEGTWYNNLGSELILTKDANGKLNGEFRTAVEAYEGAAGKSHAVVKGIVKQDPTGQLIGFSAIFNGGTSATSWAGLCQKCGGEEMLHTTWILKGYSDTCSDLWKSVRINEDVFTRRPSVAGPRKLEGTHTPQRTKVESSEETEEVQPLPETEYYNLDSKLEGKWYSEVGIQLDIANVSNGNITGKYSHGDSEVTISGNIDSWNTNSVFTIAAVREDLNAIDVWVGQHHRCVDGKEILETSSLRRKMSTCEDEDMAGFRKMSFTRTAPTKNSESGNWSALNEFAGKVSNFFTGWGWK